ncbi:MAG: 3-dehydroquinate synthase, partial [Blastocatellia bacterium]|nr:3-dehydroquinate synthase [Blastocatellia bacterium]
TDNRHPATDKMKQTVHVALDERSYDITIEEGALARVGELARQALGPKARRVAILSNERVHGEYGRRVEASLKRAGIAAKTHLIGDGERAKSLRTAERAWAFLIANRFERSDAILALGGGVVGDLAGFVAATFLRGIEYIQIPTTLLAQIDSSVGGKTAVNHPLGKNLLGAFHQPRTVIIDPATLRTLPPRELRAGLYEAVKYGVIRDRILASFIQNHLDRIRALDPATLVRVIARCCEIKAEVVTADERESGLRRILNFGHTAGHALEAVTAYRRLKHGEAVGYGMKCASAIAEKIGILPAAEAAAIRQSVDSLGRLPHIDDLRAQDVVSAMAHDKKVVQGKLPLILPTKVGDVLVRDDVAAPVIREAVRGLLAGRY